MDLIKDTKVVIILGGNRSLITVRFLHMPCDWLLNQSAYLLGLPFDGNTMPEDLKFLFGRRLRALRISRWMTQEHLAEIAGISTDFLSLVERGRNAPSFHTIEGLAQALDVSAKDLFDFENLDHRIS